jgi:hypothetical protein
VVADQAGSATTLAQQDANWADALYTHVLGGTIPDQEAAVDLPFLGLAEINARAAAAAAILGSPEYENRLTTRVYSAYLNRLPGAAELATWQAVIGTGASVLGGPTGDEKLLSAVLGSQEYFFDQGPDASGLHTNDTWLRSLYGNLLLPFNAADEAANLIALDNAYAPQRNAAIKAFTSSAEYQSDFIASAYQTYLGRNPTAAETNFWLAQFRPGPNQVTQEQLIGNLIGSVEYFNRAPAILGTTQAPSNSTFVQAAYFQLFPGYSISSGELNMWVNILNSGAKTREQVADILDTSSLYRFGVLVTDSTGTHYAGFVNQQYVKLLHRNASPAEISYWQSVYANNPGLRTEDFIGILVGSLEYFLDPHPLP